MTAVYVIIGESGEYDDFTRWVSGVYTDEQEAFRVAKEKAAESQQVAENYEAYWQARHKSKVDRQSISREVEAYEAKYGPWPKDGDATEYVVVRVELNTWGDRYTWEL